MLPPLDALRRNLSASGFDEAACCALCNVDRPSMLQPVDRPFYLRRCATTATPAARACAFWLLGASEERPWLEDLAGAEATAWMIEAGFVEPTDAGGVRARVDLSPCHEGFFWHDHRLLPPEQATPVPPLNDALYLQLNLTPRPRGKRALALYAGSGAGAVWAARTHPHVTAVAANPTALELTRLNARLNGVEKRVHTVSGELYAPLGEETFDLIQVTPPLRFRMSDPDRLRGLVDELPRRLTPGGLFAGFVTCEVMPDRSLAARVADWLGNRGWGVVVLGVMRIPLPVYIGCFAPFDGTVQRTALFNSCFDSYVREGIEEVSMANVIIKKLDPSHAGYAVQLDGSAPTTDVSAAVGGLMKALEHPPAWDRWKPAWGAHRARLWTSLDKSRVRLESTLPSLVAPLTLEASSAWVCRHINGRRTAERLAELWAEQAHVELALARSQVHNALGELTRGLFLK